MWLWAGIHELLQVVIGYVVTAFIVLVITAYYYLFVYVPDLYPFRKADASENDRALIQYRPSPIDKIFLRWIQRWPLHRPEKENERCSRLEKALIKVIAVIPNS